MSVIERFSAFYQHLSSDSLRQIGDIYADTITFIDPVTRHTGLAQVTAYFAALLENTRTCECRIQSVCSRDHEHWVRWTMTFQHDRLKSGAPITVEGVTELHVEDDKIVYHRDYYDMGEMLYEHVPVLGWVVQRIKKGMAA